MADPASPFAVQKHVRVPWRKFLDDLRPIRPDLHRYCVRLAGNVWDGEDLVQEALARVFTQLGKLDPDLEQIEHPRTYLIRTATRIWIDARRKAAREREVLVEEQGAHQDAAMLAQARVGNPSRAPEVREAAAQLLGRLAPRERAAVLLKDVFDLSLEESARILQTTSTAVKAALQRGRARLEGEERTTRPAGPLPSRTIVERFVTALSAKDLDTLKAICSDDLAIELVGGVELDGFERSRTFLEHAHMELPIAGFGLKPRWELREYLGEWLVLGFRTLNGAEGINEVHRLEESDGLITRVRCYCFCPDTLRVLGEHLGLPALARMYRSPMPEDFAKP
ncbi:MAG TPA: sigma-70 family RNA polymerase sigma factor [Myxococcota bacterium]|nr:sigma-70 family RNA polymerase sigma factor [Myxococcota bacterium]